MKKQTKKHQYINNFFFLETLPSWLFPAVSLSCYQYQDQPPEPHLLASRQPGKHGQNKNNKSVKLLLQFCIYFNLICSKSDLKVFSMCLPSVSMPPATNNIGVITVASLYFTRCVCKQILSYLTRTTYLLNDRIDNQWVLEDVLADAGVKHNSCDREHKASRIFEN